MSVNPMQLIQMIKNGSNPQQLLMNVLSQENSPIMTNLFNLAKENKTQQIEQIARNMFQQRGLDFDKEFNAFKQQLGIK